MRVSTILVASVTLLTTTAHASFADWDADEFDARGVGSAFNPSDEDAFYRSFFDEEDDFITARDIDDPVSHFYAREWEDAEDLFVSRSLYGDDDDVYERFDDELDLEYSLRDMGVEDNQELFEKAMADMDTASELALRGFIGEDDGLAEIVMRELEEDEMEIQRRQIEKAQKTLSGMTAPAPPAPSATSTTPGGVPKMHWKLAPVNCKAVTKYLHTYHKVRASYKRWKLRLEQAEKQKNAKSISDAKTRVKERKELQKRLVWALLMQGRVLN